MKNKLRFGFILLLPICASIILCEWKGDSWEEYIREFYYNKIIREPIPSYYQFHVDEKGIPFVNYEELNGIKAGKQYNPTAVGVYAINYYSQLKTNNDSTIITKFFNCISWLERNLTYENNAALYKFNWQQPFYPSVNPPWCSGLSSGIALEALTDAFLITHSEKYLSTSRALLRGFYMPIKNGGFTYADSTGMWYEEYACSNAKTPHVINGHISALLGIRKFWNLTKNDSAEYLFKQGLQSLKENLKIYDAGDGWNYYDSFHKKADKKYRKIIVDQMNTLWEITNDSVFYEYHEKWETPLIRPYIYKIIEEKNRSGIILLILVNFILLMAFYLIKRIATF